MRSYSRHIVAADVLLILPTTPELTVGEEFRRFRADRKARLSETTSERRDRELAAELLEELDEPTPTPFRDRPCGKFCRLCASLAHRVHGERCAECGRERRDEAPGRAA